VRSPLPIVLDEQPSNVIEVDGGDGGGQLVRSALALSVVSGKAVCIESIRGERPTPGLKPQHLAAVRVLARIADAELGGGEPGSETLTFDPGTPAAGEYEVDVGTAGSLTLVFDAVLPVATGLDGPLQLTVTGGTDVKWSPTSAYYRRAKLPLLRRRGLEASVEVDRWGFYPAGGGRARLRVAPSSVSPSVTGRGSFETARVVSTAARALEDAEVATRQADAAVEGLEGAGIDVSERTVRTVDSACPGSAVAVVLEYEDGIAGFDAVGERGKPAESVADEAVGAALDHYEGTAPVDEHLADQLLPFVALEGGRVRIPRVTEHVATSLDLFETFGYDLSVTERDGTVLVES
jgi:RNA 3'-terminal phosphate cyclase (ATP)